MSSLSVAPSAKAEPQVRPHSLRGCWMVFVIAVTFASIAVASGTPDAQRFQLTGSGTLTIDQPVQKNGSLQIKAYLAPSDVARPPLSSVQEGGRFALSAMLATSPLVCFNDTIFRDSFDGTGL